LIGNGTILFDSHCFYGAYFYGANVARAAHQGLWDKTRLITR